MPTYEYQCDSCMMYDTRFLPISQYRSPQKCACGETMTKLFSAPYAKGPTTLALDSRDRREYKAVLGFVPSSSKEIDDYCKKNGLAYVGGTDLAREASRKRRQKKESYRRKHKEWVKKRYSEIKRNGS